MSRSLIVTRTEVRCNEAIYPETSIEYLKRLGLITHLRMGRELMYKHYFKRLIDIVLSLSGIIVLAIPMLIIAIAIKIDDPGPAIFKQKRIGIHKAYLHEDEFYTGYYRAKTA